MIFTASPRAAASQIPATGQPHVAWPASAPSANLRISVIIPAKDEASNLPATLQALAAQTDLTGQPLDPATFEVLVLANNCRDQTAAVVRAFAEQHPTLALYVAEVKLPPAQAHVGQARRLLMDEASRRLERTAGLRGIIASTDADTRVAPTWLAATQLEIQAGADAVGGRIFPERAPRKNCSVRRTHLNDAAYRLLRSRLEATLDPEPADPWPRHHQHFGASLALTVAAYQQVGGLPVVPFLEDEALWQAMRRHDLHLRHSTAVQVATSARYAGRVAVGLSWQLREWARMTRQQREPLVESGTALATEWTARRKLRQLWAQAKQHPASRQLPSCVRLAAVLSVPAGSLAQQIASASTFGLLWEWVQKHRAVWRRGRVTTLSGAVKELRELLAQYQQPKAGVPAPQPLAADQQIEAVLRRSVAV